MRHTQSAVLGLALVALSSCAAGQTFTAPNPTAEQVQSVRVRVAQVIASTDAALTIVDETGRLLDQLPLTNETKNAYDCALLKTFGTTVPATPGVIAVCGAVPLHTASPFGVAVTQLGAVTTCPGLRASAVTVMDLVTPLLSKLEASGNASLSFAAATLRATFALLRGLSGGTVTCQT